MELPTCAAGRSISARAYIQLEHCFPGFSNHHFFKSSTFQSKLNFEIALNLVRRPLECYSCTRKCIGLSDLWIVRSGLQWLGHLSFTDCILGCTFVSDVCVRVCDHCVYM